MTMIGGFLKGTQISTTGLPQINNIVAIVKERDAALHPVVRLLISTIGILIEILFKRRKKGSQVN